MFGTSSCTKRIEKRSIPSVPVEWNVICVWGLFYFRTVFTFARGCCGDPVELFSLTLFHARWESENILEFSRALSRKPPLGPCISPKQRPITIKDSTLLAVAASEGGDMV